MRLQVRRLIGDQRVSRGVRFVEAVAREGLHLIEDLGGRLGIDFLFLRAVDETLALARHLLGIFLAHRAAENVGVAHAVAGEDLGNLHDLLLVDDDAVSVLERRLHERV